ncbi:carbohydrate-binding protein [Streptomyces actinomycinicus]|uniref:Carbohydrate-binding protein n=1 Tax=Streptomyces actinomycinicus TaxID=1695166 RepID=A0A937JNV9_9ACTN|nr:carbohydrate-binding protein [Streptomyces actinomycinicus]MBL1081838.1 carbohydrate-binding protein [Streptomyces actinomycinicus]
MTPGENGPSTPEDDPFGYLYADGQARGAQPPSGGYGYPNSVSRVRTVGERQYSQQQAPYGQPPTVPQQGAYGQPNAHYQAPETLPGGAPAGRRPAPPAGGTGRRGPNTKGLLIGAIAVVAAVVIGIGVAMINGDTDDDKSGNQAGATPTQSQSHAPSPSRSGSAAPGELPKTDASALQLGPGVTTASDIKGAQAKGGTYVTGFNHVGATVTWTVDNVEKSGTYRLYVRYGIPGVDADATLVVNNEVDSRPIQMKNFGGGTPQGDWEKGWKTTWSNVNLNKGTNTIQIACQNGNQCNAVLDQLYIVK